MFARQASCIMACFDSAQASAASSKRAPQPGILPHQFGSLPVCPQGNRDKASRRLSPCIDARGSRCAAYPMRVDRSNIPTQVVIRKGEDLLYHARLPCGLLVLHVLLNTGSANRCSVDITRFLTFCIHRPINGTSALSDATTPQRDLHVSCAPYQVGHQCSECASLQFVVN